MRERNPYRTAERLAISLTGFYTVVTLACGAKAGFDISQGASSVGEHLIGGAILAGAATVGFEKKRRHERQLRRAHEARERSRQ